MQMNKHLETSQDWVSLVKGSIVRLLFILGVWILFFQLYSQKGFGVLSYQPLIIILLSLYVILEVVIIAASIAINRRRSAQSVEQKLALIKKAKEQEILSPEQAQDAANRVLSNY